MPIRRLIGSDTIGANNQQGSYFLLSRYLCDYSGVVKELRFHSGTTGNAKVSVYTDSGGEPSARHYYNDSEQSLTAGQWNALPVTPFSLTAGVYYWIGGNGSTTGVLRRNNNSGDRRYLSATYSSFTAPDPAGSGFSSATDEGSYAAWGYIPPTITDAEDEQITDGETDFDIDGVDFETAQGTGNVYLTNHATWGSESEGPVAQPINSWSDGALNVDIDATGLTAGTVHLHVLTASGQRNAAGYALILAASGGWTNISSINGVSQSNISSVMGVSKANIAKVCGVSA